MANEIRIRSNFASGTITDNPLTNVATTINSAAFASLPAVTSTSHLPIVLDPLATAGAPEIVYVTAHTASATSATVVRGQEGSTARQHATGMAWRHAALVSDYDSVLGYAQVVANQTGIAAGPTDLTGLTVTVTVPYANHRIRVTGQGQLNWSDTATGHYVAIYQDGVAIGRAFTGGYAPNTAGFQFMDGGVILLPAAGSHTYKLSAIRYGAGTGTLTLSASSPDNPAYILVEDLGPAA